MVDGSTSFGILNWLVLLGVFLGMAVAAHLLRTKNSGLEGFFLGDRGIPWWAVSLSIIATQISGITFVAVPAAVFKTGGNLGYGQMMIGVIIGKLLMVSLFVKPYYQQLVYSPYEFMENRLGPRSSHVARVLFMVSAILSQGVRLFAIALVLSEVTGLSSRACIVIIGVFSIIYSVKGGITTVIWTDVIQFFVFTVGGLFALFWLFGTLPVGLNQAFSILDDKAKLILFDISKDPSKGFTVWVALFAFSVYELGLNATDHVVTQRIMCCKTGKDAQKAVLTSCGTVLISFLMLAVGLGLVLHYDLQPLQGEAAIRVAEQPDRIFPQYVVNNVPPGLSGLLIATIFSAGITSSTLAALSQTSIMEVYSRYVRRGASEAHYVLASKVAVVFWGIVLSVLAGAFESAGVGLLELLFAVPGYVNGPLLGIGLLALVRRGNLPSILTGTFIAIGLIIALQAAGVNMFWAYPVGTVVLLAAALPFRASPEGETRAQAPKLAFN